MKFVIYFTACIVLFSSAAWASDAPFTWPDSYFVTDKMTSLTKKDKPVIFNAYKQDGLKARNESVNYQDKIFKDAPVVEIFRLDRHKRYGVNADGAVTETKLPDDWNKSYPFPRTGTWEAQGHDVIDGVQALKYKITRAPGHTVVKLPASMQDPAHSSFKLPAELYDTKYMTKAPYVMVWLTPDNKIPLRMEDGDDRTDFLNYYAGPQDPAFFEPTHK